MAEDKYPPRPTTKRILLRLLTERSFRMKRAPSDGMAWVDDIVRAALNTDTQANLKIPLAAHLTAAFHAMTAALPTAGSSKAEDVALRTFLVRCLDDWRRESERLGLTIPGEQDPIPAVALRLFSDLFDFAVTVTETAYARHAHGYGRAPPIVLTLTAQEAEKNELGGCTEFPPADSDRKRHAQVTLALPAQHFHLSDYLISPYVMFHEIFVHCPQNLHLTNARTPQGELSAFSEGFVDAVAIRVFRRALHAGAKFPSAQRQYADEIADYSQRAHDSRSDRREAERLQKIPQNAKIRQAIEARAEGRAAFEQLERLREADGTQDFDDLARLVLSLNTLGWSADERRHFMCRLIDALDGIRAAAQGDAPPASPRQVDRLDALSRFAETGEEAVLRRAFGLDKSLFSVQIDRK